MLQAYVFISVVCFAALLAARALVADGNEAICYSDCLLEGLRKTTESLIRDSKCPVRDSKPAPTEYKLKLFLPEPVSMASM
jgi:hypothetical protein